MGKRQPNSCGLGPALEAIGGKWKALLLWQLHKAPARFGELKRLVPEISEKMLIQQLREMEADGLVNREIFAEVPPRVEYSITEFGVELDNALIPLARWGKEYAGRAARQRQGKANALAPQTL
ncbi:MULTISPECIES: helix-turn-helix domain-containing protein [unclassified Mesorhizobium]|uniref:winged helix-turn-helix transcriptional regulator n=1 Tax=unclassified Mesorhizobium TaxID=325217 RepID=UPI0011261856|nr:MULTISPECIES: helix-turn-helix domain-containing protein [unclassified Mesorhizobium]TPJ28894.1 helix-turn-helix transcriptional regulator [Mesorhizobium sp. B2-7-2]TPO00917.1 helix-turn-helix transcriptional regulator [Mesorhizobium sp. B1-1-5]